MQILKFIVGGYGHAGYKIYRGGQGQCSEGQCNFLAHIFLLSALVWVLLPVSSIMIEIGRVSTFGEHILSPDEPDQLPVVTTVESKKYSRSDTRTTRISFHAIQRCIERITTPIWAWAQVWNWIHSWLKTLPVRNIHSRHARIVRYRTSVCSNQLLSHASHR